MVNDCQLRDNLGAVLGASRSTGGFSEFTKDAHEITVNGGYTVQDGDPSKVISLWCRSEFDTGKVDGAQLITVKIGGFQ